MTFNILDSDPDLLRVTRVRDILTCSKSQVYKLKDAKELDAIPIGLKGRCIRITKESVIKYIERQKRSAEERAPTPSPDRSPLRHLQAEGVDMTSKGPEPPGDAPPVNEASPTTEARKPRRSRRPKV